MTLCQKCGYNNFADNKFCTSCGSQINLAISPIFQTRFNEDIEEISNELENLAYVLNLLHSQTDDYSLKAIDQLNNRRIKLLEILDNTLAKKIYPDTSKRLDYFFKFVQHIVDDYGIPVRASEFYSVAIAKGFENHLELVAGPCNSDQTYKPISDEKENTFNKSVYWKSIWLTLFSENLIATFLGFGILLIVASSLVFLVTWWPNHLLRPYLVLIAIGQIIAFVIVGHIIKNKIGLHYSGIAFITIGAVWAIFTGAMITYLFFDLLNESLKIPGLNLYLNLPPLGWLVTGLISTPIWGILGFKYKGYVLVQGFIFLLGISIVLTVASFGDEWTLWRWAIIALPLYLTIVIWIRKFFGRIFTDIHVKPLVWMGMIIGVLPFVILVFDHISNSDQSSLPLSLVTITTAFTTLVTAKLIKLRWLEHIGALLIPLSLYFMCIQVFTYLDTYFNLILISISTIYLYLGFRINLTPVNNIENKFPFLNPWHLISIILMVITSMANEHAWVGAICMASATLISGLLIYIWKKDSWSLVPLLPLTIFTIYLIDTVPLYAGFAKSYCDFCQSIPVGTSIPSVVGFFILILVRIFNRRFIISGPLILWSMGMIIFSVITSFMYSSNGIEIGYVKDFQVIIILIYLVFLLFLLKLLSIDNLSILWNPLLIKNADQDWQNTLLLPFLRSLTVLLILLLIPVWILSAIRVSMDSHELIILPSIVWCLATLINYWMLLKYKRDLFLFAVSITCHIALIVFLNGPIQHWEIIYQGMFISVFAILFVSMVATYGICNKNLISNSRYLIRKIYLTLFFLGLIDATAGLVLAGWNRWDNWQGLSIVILYTIISFVLVHITRSKILPYITLFLLAITNIFIVGIYEGTWADRYIVWAIQGLVYWWISIAINKYARESYSYLWVKPLNNSSSRMALLATIATAVAFLVDYINNNDSYIDLITPTSVLAILGILYLSKAIQQKNILAGYISAAALLLSWIIQVIGRDLGNIQFYTFPIGLYLLGLAYFGNIKFKKIKYLTLIINMLAVLLLCCSSFVQSISDNTDNKLFFVLLMSIEAIGLVVWGLFTKSKISFLGGIFAFSINVLYQLTAFISDFNGAILTLSGGITIIVLVVIFEKTRSRLMAKGTVFLDNLEQWNW